jgi:hypothetical protein
MFKVTETVSSAITSLSAAQVGHHARLLLRLRRINRESISIVIVVRFAMSGLLAETSAACQQCV